MCNFYTNILIVLNSYVYCSGPCTNISNDSILETMLVALCNQDPSIVFRFPINLYLYSFLLLL